MATTTHTQGLLSLSFTRWDSRGADRGARSRAFLSAFELLGEIVVEKGIYDGTYAVYTSHYLRPRALYLVGDSLYVGHGVDEEAMLAYVNVIESGWRIKWWAP